MNSVKSLVQKEEYIALAINKYILQTAKVPKVLDGTVYVLDWDKLLVDEYLGKNFNRFNPLLNKNITVVFDSSNNAYIKGVVTSNTSSEYDSDYKFLYNFYTNYIYRVNTRPPVDTTESNLYKGSRVLYSTTQQEVVNVINSGSSVLLSNDTCTASTYFYELELNKLTYKYCKTNLTSIDVYQKSPVFLDDYKDLAYIKSDIGAKAYVMKNNFWYEYYFQGNVAPYWIPTGDGTVLTVVDDTLTLEQRLLAYIPSAKDVLIRNDGGCMLANGDIFCWGNNEYKKAGVQNYGQLDSTLSADYVNTPVMLRVQSLDTIPDSEIDTTINNYKWHNNPYRIKFEKIGINSKNVCGISPYFESLGVGGDLYCNGLLDSDNFQDLSISGESENSTLKRNIHFYNDNTDADTTNNKFLKDIAMVEDVIAVLTYSGEIYTIGTNKNGALGINNTDLSFSSAVPTLVNNGGQVFTKIFALRDLRTFGAIDSLNRFWIWGERLDGTNYYEPTLLAAGKEFDSDNIFINPEEFILKGLVDKVFYRTYDSSGSIDIVSLSIPSTAINATYYDYKGTELIGYITENMQFGGTSALKTCYTKDLYSCTTTEDTIFNGSFNSLNDATNKVNGTDFGSFSNISIFTNKEVSTVSEVSYLTYEENFEDSSTTGWNIGYIHDGGSVASKFLGRYGKNRIVTSSGAETLYKIFNLGSDWANKNVKITFDMYEIDSWDAGYWYQDNLNGMKESFYVYINGKQVDADIYVTDNLPDDTKEGVSFGANIPGTYDCAYCDEKHTYTYVITLDSNGSFRLGFGAILGEDYTNESFGIDNIKITTQIDNVTFTNGVYTEDFENKKSDGWNVPRGPVPYVETSYPYFVDYPIYEDYHIHDGIKTHDTYFLGRFNKLSYGGTIYHGNSDGSQEVSKIFSFGSNYAGKEVRIEYDFFRIDNWRNDPYYTIDKFYDFINDTKTEVYPSGAPSASQNDIADTQSTHDYKYHYSKTAYLDEYGAIKLGFGAYIKDNYIDQTSWGVDNIKFTLTGNTDPNYNPPSGTQWDINTKLPFVCAMTGLDTASQMYCWGNVGRAIPILSTSLYDVSKITTLNKLFITQSSEKNNSIVFDEFNNNGKLFLKYPTYIGGFDYPFYFK